MKHVEEMIAEGMDIVDIGGESTRLGYTLLSDEEEIARVVPMIEAVKANFDIPISWTPTKAVWQRRESVRGLISSMISGD